MIALKPSTPFTDDILFKFEDFKGRSILSGDFVAWDASALFKLLSLAKFLDKRLGFDSEVLPFDSLVFLPSEKSPSVLFLSEHDNCLFNYLLEDMRVFVVNFHIFGLE